VSERVARNAARCAFDVAIERQFGNEALRMQDRARRAAIVAWPHPVLKRTQGRKRMPYSMLNISRTSQQRAPLLAAALAVASIMPVAALAAALPAPPQTFDSSYVAPTGTVLKVAAGDNLQAVFDKAQLGQTIVLPAGATFKGPFKLPNKSGSGWIYVVSSHLASLPPPGTRVGPANASNMPKIVAPNGLNTFTTVAGSHHFRFVGIEFAPASGTTIVYSVVAIGNADRSPATLAHHIVFDRCYVHANSSGNARRGIKMDGAYVAVVDSYISGFQDGGADSQGLWAYNTTGPLQIRNNYIEAATENVMFGGADSYAATLVPTSIEIRDNHFFKPLSLITSTLAVKNLLELKAARRVLVTGNIFENNPAKTQNGFAVVITPRNQNGAAPWSVTSDIAVVGNRFINLGSGFNLLGRDNIRTSAPTQHVLIRNNLIEITGLNGATGTAFQFINGGSDYIIDHNSVINTAGAVPRNLGLADTASNKVARLVFTNNLSTHSTYGFFSSGSGQGTAGLNADFVNWTFSHNVIIGAPAGNYPAGNYFPAAVAAVRFMSYAGGNYTLAAGSPYKNAAIDHTDIGASDTP
jgi:hypothetical protein